MSGGAGGNGGQGLAKVSYQALGVAIGRLVERKQAQYGNSFGDAPKLLAILYPNGIRPEQYTDVLTVARVLDKVKRIATRHASDMESPWEDIAGYALLAWAEEQRRKEIAHVE